jgi:hypothetical protein
MAGENTPVRFLPGGSVLEVASGGTVSVLAGGSIQNAGGQSVASLSATNATFAGTVSIGGTAGRWAFGSAALDTGTALVYTGLTQIVAVHAAPIKASPGTATTAPSSFQIDASRFANGTFYALGLAGTFNYAGGGTFTWQAHGF